MLNFILSILVHKKVLTEAEGEKLAAELVSTTHPSDFQLAHKIVERILQK